MCVYSVHVCAYSVPLPLVNFGSLSLLHVSWNTLLTVQSACHQSQVARHLKCSGVPVKVRELPRLSDICLRISAAESRLVPCIYTADKHSPVSVAIYFGIAMHSHTFEFHILYIGKLALTTSAVKSHHK